MTIEELKEKRKYFAWRAAYFTEISFPTMAEDFSSMTQIIDELIAATEIKESELKFTQEIKDGKAN